MSYGANNPSGVPLGLPSIVSLGLAPLVNPYPALNLDFINNQTLDSRITFSRGSQATLFDSTGTLKYAKSNVLLQSQNFATTWSANNVSVSTDSTSAPDGTTTADTLNDGVVAAASHSLIQTPTIGVSTTYVASFFAKNVDRRYVGFAISTTSSNNYGTVEFDLSGAGAVSRTAVLGTGFAIVSSSITSVGDGWFRCVATITTGTAAVTDGRATLYLSDGAGAFDSRGRATYSGANASIYAWGAQLNLANMEGGVTSSLTTYYPTTTAAYYAPRFDYNPSTLQPLGLLIEEARTNLLLQSGWAGATSGTPGAAPTSWTVGFGTNTVTTVLTSNFDPTANAVKFDCDSGERVMFQQAINVTNGVQYALSAYLEAVSGLIGDGLLVTAGTATVTQNTFVTQPSTPGRYTILFTATGTGTVTIRVGVGTSASVGSAASATWSHPQVEAGAFATSYIPTTTTALTRNADVASMTGTNFSSWYSASEGTVVAETQLYSTTARNAAGFDINDGSTNNRNIFRAFTTGSADQNVIRSGGSTVATMANAAAPTTAIRKSVSAYKVDDFAFTANGVAPQTDTLGAVPSGVNQLLIGYAAGPAEYLSGYIRRLAFYPQRLPNTTLQALTA